MKTKIVEGISHKEAEELLMRALMDDGCTKFEEMRVYMNHGLQGEPIPQYRMSGD